MRPNQASPPPGSAKKLEAVVDEFTLWLNTEASVDAWLPSINRQVIITIPRCLVLKIGGNLSKHNNLRAIGVAEDLQKLLANAGQPIELYEAMLALEDVYEIFHEDVAAYHMSTIAEFLNNLWWTIQFYLQPEYRRSLSYDQDDEGRYRYQYPVDITHAFAKTCYWNLMNQVRSGPIFDLFVVTRHLKGRY